MNIKFWVLIFSMTLTSTMVSATENWLIATDNEMLNTSQSFDIEVIKPSTLAQWPEILTLKLSNREHQENITLSLVHTKQLNNIKRTYQGVTKKRFSGAVRAQLQEQTSNRLLMLANEGVAPKGAATETVTASNTVATEEVSRKAESKKTSIVVESPEEDPTITANEPLYFLFGSNDERSFDARFQLSFKYRPFDPGARVAKFIPYASNIYFAYTQTSIWDLGGESSPFRDTSYRPSVYYHWKESGKGLNPSSWKFGLEHESNGRDEENSRSLNIAFVQPHWDIDFFNENKLTLMPRIYAYLEKTDNRDMHNFRGYVDWMARFGREDKLILTGLYRQGTDGYAFGQLDLSYPISDKLFGRTGSFLHLQFMQGYGETLLDYNRDSNPQLRIGLSLAR